MTFAYFDRVKETTTTTGTGTLTLAGAVAGFQSFGSVYANGDTLHYVIQVAGGAWEVGYGTWNTGNLLARNVVLASSNANALVNFAAGSKDVFVSFPAGVPSRTGASFFTVLDATTRDGLPAALLRLGDVARLLSDNTCWQWSGSAWTFFSLDCAPVVAASPVNLVLTGAYTVDGRTMSNGEVYLAPNQTDPTKNGKYVYASGGAHARAPDMDLAPKFRPGAWFAITGGERFGGGFATVDVPPVVLGTDPIVFAVIEPDPAQDKLLRRVTTDAVGSMIKLSKARGVKASPLAHAAGDVLGRYVLEGFDGAAFYEAFVLQAVAEAAGGTGKSVRFESFLHNGLALNKTEASVNPPPVNTTGATLTTVYSLQVLADQILSIAARWVGVQTSGSPSNRAIRETTLLVRRSGSGNVVEVTHADAIPAGVFKDDAGWGDATQIGYTLNNTTHAVDFTVQGKASTNITWTLDLVWAVR